MKNEQSSQNRPLRFKNDEIHINELHRSTSREKYSNENSKKFKKEYGSQNIP